MREDNGNVEEPRQKRNALSKWWKIGLLVGGLFVILVIIGGWSVVNQTLMRWRGSEGIDKMGGTLHAITKELGGPLVVLAAVRGRVWDSNGSAVFIVDTTLSANFLH